MVQYLFKTIICSHVKMKKSHNIPLTWKNLGRKIAAIMKSTRHWLAGELGIAWTRTFKGSNSIFSDPLRTAKPKFKGSKVLNDYVAHLKKISWFTVS